MGRQAGRWAGPWTAAWISGFVSRCPALPCKALFANGGLEPLKLAAHACNASRQSFDAALLLLFILCADAALSPLPSPTPCCSRPSHSEGV